MADSRLSTQGYEALTDATPARNVSSISQEVLTNAVGQPTKNLTNIGIEALHDVPTPTRNITYVALEVLAPRVIPHIGWGAPIKSAVWS